MIRDSIIFINFGIFALLSLLHIYWAFGGKWAIEYTVPNEWKASYFEQKNRFKVSAATIIVAIGLMIFAFVTLSNYHNLGQLMPSNYSKVLSRIIGGIFLLRAVGDFNYFGIFKKKSTTKFAIKDSQIFVPLCLYLGISSILITLMNF